MTNQEIFSKVLTHLRKQGFAVSDANCCYRTEDGRSCAAGVLIKDEFYDPECEGASVQADTVTLALNRSIGAFDLEFIQTLQNVHDECAELLNEDGTKGDMLFWEDRMQKIAENYGLRFE